MNIACKYVGPMADFSGYGDANRSFVYALHEAGVDLTVEVLSYSGNTINYFGEKYKIIKSLANRNINYDIKIVHVPCDSYLKFLEPCKFHIGHLFWETDKMSPEWVWNCNLMDEIWTGSEHNKKAFENSGVWKPIWVFPQPIDTDINIESYKPWKIPGHEGFLFYSIFQWIERKNPRALIEAYLREFNRNEKVGLLIKTYREKFLPEEKEMIVGQIQQWKKEVGKEDAPPIYLSIELMDQEDVFRIHRTGDCFVLPHRGEGWGRPIAEAMLFKKPVIATNCGGIHDHLPEEVYLPLSYKLTNVFGMEFAPWYREDQKWADVSVDELRGKMRWVFEHQDEAGQIGEKGYEFTKKNFSYKAVGRMLKDRLVDIQRTIDEQRKKGIKWP